MDPQQNNLLGEMIMLPVLLIIALAVWFFSFLTGNRARRQPL